MEQSKIELIKDLGMKHPKETSKYKLRYGLYKCYCGNEFTTSISSVNQKKTQSCGCYAELKITKHKMCYSRIYKIWLGIKARCLNSSDTSYKYYGGRGIFVCNEWRNDFMSFYHWAMENGYRDDLSIDRIYVNGNYEPLNCRWATKSTQSQNQSKRTTNKSGYIGINWHKHRQKWRAYISIEQKQISIGYFKEIEEAVKERNNYIVENNLSHSLNNEKGAKDKEKYKDMR